MDEAVRDSIVEAYDRSLPWVQQYQSWVNGEYAMVRAKYEKSQSPWVFHGGGCHCYHYNGWHNFASGPAWKEAGVYWQFWMNYEDFVAQRLWLHLRWNRSQPDADEFRSALANECVAQGVPPNTAGGGLGAYSAILSHTITYSGGSFTDVAYALCEKVHLFDSVINATLAGLGLLRGALTLTAVSGRTLVLTHKTAIGREQVKSLGDESKFYSHGQYAVRPVSPGEWCLEPNPTAKNATMLNGVACTTPTALKSGDVVAVGNPAKGITKLSLTVKVG